MRRYIAAVIVCISLSAHAQSMTAPAMGTTAKAVTGSGTTTASPFATGAGGMSVEKKSKFEKLMGEARKACPECSNGGTVDGTLLIKGANIAGDTPIRP